VRQHPVGRYRTRTYRAQPGFKTLTKPSRSSQQRHAAALKQEVRARRGVPQGALIFALNPKIRGWTLYYRGAAAKRVFARQDAQVYSILRAWARRRHPGKSESWRYRRYWLKGEQARFSDGRSILLRHDAQPIQRHIKVRGTKSPYDGDWVYWSARLGRHPAIVPRVARLLKQQQGRCDYCALYFTTEDVLEVHHRDGNHANDNPTNLALLHGACHDLVHARRYA
jgi:RNA-directed DNA polymerase